MSQTTATAVALAAELNALRRTLKQQILAMTTPEVSPHYAKTQLYSQADYRGHIDAYNAAKAELIAHQPPTCAALCEEHRKPLSRTIPLNTYVRAIKAGEAQWRDI